MYAENISPIHSKSDSSMKLATVKSINDSQVLILSDSGIHTATIAFSCLVKPKVGDSVMVSYVEQIGAVIVAIISRTQSNDVELEFENDVSLISKQGDVHLGANKSINLSSESSLNVLSDELSLIASKGLLNIKTATFNSDKLTSTINAITTMAKTVDTVADRMTQHLKHSIRQIQGVDQTKAGEALLTVKNLFSLRAKQTAVLAKKDIKIDAKRIHMG